MFTPKYPYKEEVRAIVSDVLHYLHIDEIEKAKIASRLLETLIKNED